MLPPLQYSALDIAGFILFGVHILAFPITPVCSAFPITCSILHIEESFSKILSDFLKSTFLDFLKSTFLDFLKSTFFKKKNISVQIFFETRFSF